MGEGGGAGLTRQRGRVREGAQGSPDRQMASVLAHSYDNAAGGVSECERSGACDRVGMGG